MNRLTLLAFIVALAPQAVFADDAPAAAADPTLAPANCKQPEMHTRLIRDTSTHDPRAEFEAYQQCVKDYVETQKKLQQLHFEAGSKALKDFNDFIPAWNDFQNQPH